MSAERRRAQERVEALMLELVGARSVLGLPQEHVGVRLGVSHVSVFYWESGRIPTTRNLIAWAGALDRRLVLTAQDGRHHEAALAPTTTDKWEEFELRRLAGELAAARRTLGKSQAALAHELGVSAWIVSVWETLRGAPRPVSLVRWARAVDCEIALIPRRDALDRLLGDAEARGVGGAEAMPG